MSLPDRLRWVLSAIVATVVVSLLLMWRSYQAFLDEPLMVPQPMTFEMPAGASYRAMVNRLRSARLTDVSWPWRLHGWLSDDVARLQAGEYALQPGITPRQWLQRMVDGDVIQHAFTIIEGWNYTQLRAQLAETPQLTQTLADVSHQDLMARLGSEGLHPEGWFLPETYLFTRGTTDLALLQRAHRAMQAALDRAWQQRDVGVPLDDPYQALTLASIIEKETGRADERGRIAGVFARRLAKGMRLQTDPTVIYGMGSRFDGDIRYRDLRTDTPYNTYTRHGLPPTPIALPSEASLLAAVQPEPGDALYFVARGDGSHVFSATLEEHNRAVNRYQRGLP